jgi:predicted ATPase
VAVLTGEPGIGKSRIAVALQEQLQGDPHTRLRHFCSPHHQDTALYPVISQLERAAGFTREDMPRRGSLSWNPCSANPTLRPRKPP